MDVAEVLRNILVVLVAAKVAAEIAERIGVPAVVGEILAGIAVGPSLLGLVGDGDEVLHTLGEIGVILLLLEVGLEMDLRELAKVGRASMLVATVGVACPLVLGLWTMQAMGEDFNTALFIGAALTATSVGITARVFGDLRALATTEARLVLGAAVVDDVMGLMVLTVVVRIVTEGSVSLLSVAGIFGLALLFLVAGTGFGLRVAPPLFAALDRLARSTGTLVALALAFTLAFAELADAARLAPIVGAFVAGIALSRSDQSERIRNELAPVGHLFIPVFFLQIGIDADIGEFASATVLRDAAILLAVAVVGKLVSPLGAVGTSSDKPLIGLGMLPRGEVGLIFATIGLREGVLGDDLYAALLLVVLATTLITPPLLKLRYTQLGRDARPTPVASSPPPQGGWLGVDGGVVHVRGTPGDDQLLAVALEAAVLVGRNRPGDDLLERLAAGFGTPGPGASPRSAASTWGPEERHRLLDLVERGNARSWRFLEATGAFEVALPELAAAPRRGGDDPFLIDPLQAYRLRSMERLRMLDDSDPLALECRQIDDIDDLFLGALLVEGLQDAVDPVADARALLARLGADDGAAGPLVDLVADRDLLWSAARQPGALGEEAVLQLASHLGSPAHARLLYCVTALRDDGRERWERQRLCDLYELVQGALAHPELTGDDASSLDGLRRAEAARLVGPGATTAAGPTAVAGSANGVDRGVLARIEHAPRSYILRHTPEVIARHARLVDGLPRRGQVRVEVVDAGGGAWWIDVATRDRSGLLATVTAEIAAAGFDVTHASVATWDDGGAIESFRVRGADKLVAEALAEAVEASLGEPPTSEPRPDAEAVFDGTASPWHTVCEVRGEDRPGLLHDVAAAFAAAGVEVLSASILVEDGLAIDRFEVVGGDGAKLRADDEARVRAALRQGTRPPRRRFGLLAGRGPRRSGQ